MGNLWNRGIIFLRKEKSIEMVNEKGEKEMLHISKHILSEEANPISSKIYVDVVYPPSPQENHRISVHTSPFHTYIVPPIIISSRQVVVDD
jgi:hypothetical protein